MATWTLSQAAAASTSSVFWNWASVSPGKPTMMSVATVRPRHSRPGVGKPIEPKVGGVGSAHPPEDLVVARLDGQVQVLADAPEPPHLVEQLVGHVLGVGGQEPEPVETGDRVARP
jgi:hypothetical protein